MKEGSRVTPSIFGVFSRRSSELLQVIRGWELNCLVQGVKKSVADDFEGAMERWLCWAQSTMGLNELCNLADSSEASRVLSGRESAMVTPSAYEVFIMAGVRPMHYGGDSCKLDYCMIETI